MAQRAVVVTGASTGIGRAAALRLAASGWRVFAGVRKEADGEALVADATGSLQPLHLDVTDDAGVVRAFDEVREALAGGGLAGLVNNAGIALGGPLEYLSLDRWRNQFDVNVIGQVAVTRAALPLLRLYEGPSRRKARIVFVGSNSGRVSTPLMGPYVGSKFAIEGIADALRMELRKSGIGVVVIEPGAVKTPIWDKGRELAAELEQELGSEGMERYRDLVEAINRGIEMQDKNGVPADKVAASIEKSLDARVPIARRQVGVDSKVGVVAARFLPDRIKDFAIRKLVKV